jgi:cell division septum initiation protein DivIVA
VDDREFAVVPMGYDKEQVSAYLGEVEASFRKIERWAEEAKVRLRIASSISQRTHVRHVRDRGFHLYTAELLTDRVRK